MAKINEFMQSNIKKIYKVKLNENEVKVLEYLESIGHVFDAPAYVGFAPISRATGIESKKVRLACRSLKRKGLADFATGLVTEDGDFAGAGYGITERGLELLEEGGQESIL